MYQSGDNKPYDKKYWKTKNFNCDKEGHPSSHCLEGNKKDGKKKEHKRSDNNSKASHPVNQASLTLSGYQGK